MKAMRRQMIYTLLIALAFVVFQLLHHNHPMKLPSDALVQGSTVQVPLTVIRTEKQMNDNWTLYQGQKGAWTVYATNGRQAFHYVAQGTLSKDKDGTNYSTDGTIQFNGRTYMANRIHVDSAHIKGYIVFRSITAPAKGNLTAVNTAS